MSHPLSEAEAAARLHTAGFTPLEPYPGSVVRPWKMRCDLCGALATTSLQYLAKREYRGCARCATAQQHAANAVSESEALHRAREAGLTPLEPYPGHTKVPWRCRCDTCGSEVSPRLNGLSSQGGCEVCGVEAARAKQRMSAREAKKRMVEAGLTPLEPYPGSGVPWKAQCRKCGTVVSPRLSSLTRQGGCVECGRRNHSKQRITGGSAKAVAILRKTKFEPLEDYPGRSARWKVRCQVCGKRVEVYLASIERTGRGCPACAKNAPLSEGEAKAILRRAQRKLLVDYTNSYDRVPMRCLRCGGETRATINSLRKSRGGCNQCKPTAKFSADQAIELMRAAGMEPLVPYENAQTPWRARCLACGTEGSPRLGNVRSGQRGCRVCGNYGYNINKPAILYVLVHREYDAIKIGITNIGSVRMRDLTRVGWRKGKLFEFDEGRTPLDIETIVLRRIRREMKLKPALTRAQMRGVGGSTETFRRSELSTRRVYGWIRALME